MTNQNITFKGHTTAEAALDRRERLLAARSAPKGGNNEQTYDYHNDPLYKALTQSVKGWKEGAL